MKFFPLSVPAQGIFLSNRTCILSQVVNRMGCDSEYFHVFLRLTFDTLAFNCDKRATHQFCKLQFASQADKQDASLRHF